MVELCGVQWRVYSRGEVGHLFEDRRGSKASCKVPGGVHLPHARGDCCCPTLATNCPADKTIRARSSSISNNPLCCLSRTDEPNKVGVRNVLDNFAVVPLQDAPCGWDHGSASDSSKNPNQHAMMCALKGSPDKGIFKIPLRAGDLDVRLWLSIIDNNADTIDRSGLCSEALHLDG